MKYECNKYESNDKNSWSSRWSKVCIDEGMLCWLTAVSNFSVEKTLFWKNKFEVYSVSVSSAEVQ